MLSRFPSHKDCRVCRRSLDIRHFECLSPGELDATCKFCRGIERKIELKKIRKEILAERQEMIASLYIGASPSLTRRLREYERSDGSVTQKVLASMRLEASGKPCPYCRTVMDVELIAIDHIHPVAKNGLHSVVNLLACCKPCNGKKSEMLPAQWLDKLPEDIRAEVLAIYESRVKEYLQVHRRIMERKTA